ncbi:TnsA endonuclease N-terminal domain-containing protein [Paracoccus sp. IB05]|nr:TnsA endonuclease N-terminal domain-containing protein [Paracoccus sp. IB05]
MIAMLPAFPRPRVIQFESMLEYRFLCLTLVRDDVVDIVEQPPALVYQRQDGTRAHHTFDFLLRMADGERIAVAIKPAERVIRRDFMTELRHVAAAMPKHFAHRIKLVTDEHLDKRAAADAARQLMRSRPALSEVAA